MSKFAYNNNKNASSSYIFFELNYKYYFCIFYKKNFNLYSNSKIVEKLFFKFQDLIVIYQFNFYYTQKLPKHIHNKGNKYNSYVLGEKSWLNSKYFKIKRNSKLKAKFFYFF